MKFVLSALVLALALLTGSSADAATCFWRGGSGNWDNSNTASWANASGGTASTCAATGGIPKNAGDVATFDANSGSPTVTVCGAGTANCPTSSGLISIGQITVTGAFGGTLAFNTNNPNVTLSSAWRTDSATSGTVNCGTGTFTITNTAGGNDWDDQGTATITCSSAAIVFAPASLSAGMAFNPKASTSYGAITLTWPSSTTAAFGFNINISTAATFASFAVTVASPLSIIITQSTTLTITAAPAIVGTLTNPIIWVDNLPANGGHVTITTPNTFTCAYCGFQATTLTNATTLSNAWILGFTSGITATAPSAGGGGHVIGG